MRRLAVLLAIGFSLSLCGQVVAQPGRPGPGPRSGGGDDIRKLQEELDKVQALLKDLEAKMKSAKQPPAPPAKDERRSFGPGSYGPPFGKGPGGFGPPAWGQHGWGHHGWGPPGFGKAPTPSTSSAKTPSVNERLDKIESDIREIKQLLTRGKR